MAVAFDANAAADTAGSGTLGTTGVSGTNLTVGSGSNRALVVALCFSGQAASVTSVAVVWDSGASNQACTLITSKDTTGGAGHGQVQLWGLVNPVAGAKTLKVTWNAVNSDVYMCGTSWTGAHQTGGTTTFPNSASIAGTAAGSGAFAAPAPLVITSAVGNGAMAVTVGDFLGLISAPTQTQTFLDNSLTIDGGAARAAGAATVSFNWSTDIAGKWALAGTDILAAGAAAAKVAYQPWQQAAPIVAQ